MTGRITGISGPTVRTDVKGLKLYERVFVGNAMLTGEVVRIEKDSSVVQVYEDTRGLAIDEPVKATGMPLTVRLGPGLLSGIFDGLQRPLQRLKEESGPFIKGVKELSALDTSGKWTFHAVRKKGDEVTAGEIVGYVKEGPFEHYICRK
jgi:V/A-type H+-transporting ATPase subunit A